MHRSATAAVALAALGVVGLPARAGAGYPPPPQTTAGSRAVKVVAVGDIACAPGADRTRTSCRQRATARLVQRLTPTAVLALGDTQYERGDLTAYRSAYAQTWGALRPVTRPVPGNHEYETTGASGYYRYFANRQPGPPGWYAFRLGRWRAYALNSECGIVDCAAERRWMRRDLAAHPRRCSLLYMHRPRWSSGLEHGGNGSVSGLWTAAVRHGVDVALAGHEHGYERFRRLDARGRRVARGVQSFVVGTGGRSLYPFGPPEIGSVVRDDSDFGVLVLRLRPQTYSWQFRSITGQVVDRGHRSCR